MCELLGMSASVPTDICFSFAGLMQRGGNTGVHRDGWGLAFYEGKGVREFREPVASAESALAQLVQSHPIKSCCVIGHIRQANAGRVCLENTHPFVRELWGRSWAFAHNGQLRGVKRRALGLERPIGTTDSEHAFCWLLGELRSAFPDRPASSSALAAFLKHACDDLRDLGVFNLLMSDSNSLYCYASTKLHWITRCAPFGEARLKDADLSVDFGKEAGASDVVSVIATEPLTANERWELVPPGEMLVFRKGRVARALR